jgi:hypothetical protein
VVVGQANLGPGHPVDGQAALQVLGADGKWSTLTQTRTYQGYFRLPLTSLPASFRVRVSGDDGSLLASDRQSFDAAHRQVIVNAVTTLAALDRDRHPGRSVNDSLRAARRFLSIPAYWDLDNGLDMESSPFGHAAFLEAARQHGGVNAWLSYLVDQLEGGRSARTVSKALGASHNYFGIGSFTALGLAQGISGGIAGHLFGNLLSSVGAGGLASFLGLAQPSYASQLAEIVSLLSAIKDELQTIESELSTIEKQLAAGNFSDAVKTLVTAYADIDNHINDPIYQINYTTDQTHAYVMANQAPYDLDPSSLKSDLSTIASTLVQVEGPSNFFGYYIAYFNQLTSSGYTTRAQWDTLVQQWYAQAWLYQIKALNALVEYYHYTAVPGVNPVSGDPYRNNAAARDLLTVAYNLRLQEQYMLSLIEFNPQVGGAFLSQDVVRGLSIGGLGQESVQGTVVSTTAATGGGLQITWTQSSGPPLRIGMTLDIDQYAVRVRQVSSDEADAQGQQVFVGEAPPGGPALPSSFAAGQALSGGALGSLLADGVAYDMANQVIWLLQPFGPFDSLPLNGSYCDPNYCNASQGGPTNSPWYPSAPNLGSGQTHLGDWLTTQMPQTSTGQTGYFVPLWSQASRGALNLLSRSPVGGFLGATSPFFYCSDSSLSYVTDSACSQNPYTGLIDQNANATFNVGGYVGYPSYVLQNSNGDGPQQGDPCGYCTEFPVDEVSVWDGTCQLQSAGIPWANVAVYTPATPPSSYVIRAFDANGKPAVDGHGNPFPDNGPFTFEQGTAYRLDLVATLSDGSYSVGRDALWTVTGPNAFQPDGDFAGATVYIDNITGMEGCLTVLPTATAGAGYGVSAQLGSQTVDATVLVAINSAYPTPPPTPSGQAPVWNGVDPCASITVFKDKDVVSLENQTAVNVGVFARFRPTSMDLSDPLSRHTMRSADYGLDLTYTDDSHLTSSLQYVALDKDGKQVLETADSSVATVTYGGANWVVQPLKIPSDAYSEAPNRMTLLIGFTWNGPVAQSDPQATSLTQVVVVKDP